MRSSAPGFVWYQRVALYQRPRFRLVPGRSSLPPLRGLAKIAFLQQARDRNFWF